MNFTQNEHVKLNETCLDTKGHFKATFSNFMDVLGRLTSKLHETQDIDYIRYNNFSKYLITSLITHKHIEPHMMHIGD